jgi:DNA-binding LacI/PurR family transcriptional regulator
MDKLAERWKSFRGDLAILSYDDEHAIRFMTAMHKIGLNAPDDYAIIGYNDTEASRYSDPPLSSVRQNFDYIGEWLLKSALGLSKNRVCQSSKDPKLQLLVRNTCGGMDHLDTLKTFQLPTIDLILDSKGLPEPVISEEDEEEPALSSTP